jgi:hypothetical protein
LAAQADELAARIPDSALLALPPDYSLVAMEVVRGLIRRKAKGSACSVSPSSACPPIS